MYNFKVYNSSYITGTTAVSSTQVSTGTTTSTDTPTTASKGAEGKGTE